MVKAAGRMHGSFEERMLNNLEKSTKKRHSDKKLTLKQVIRALRRLEQGWPDGVEIFVGDGTVHLMDSPPDGGDGCTPSGCNDQSNVIMSFPGIPADGGGW
jgi:hypothetical protein